MPANAWGRLRASEPLGRGGTISGNTATNNGAAGFLVGGAFADGFSLSNTATFGSNLSTDNTGKGYDIEGASQTGGET